nr:MAG TPA_asm: hypothetical protein [Bacteriophage sp.]
MTPHPRYRLITAVGLISTADVQDEPSNRFR